MGMFHNKISYELHFYSNALSDDTACGKGYVMTYYSLSDTCVDKSSLSIHRITITSQLIESASYLHRTNSSITALRKGLRLGMSLTVPGSQSEKSSHGTYSTQYADDSTH